MARTLTVPHTEVLHINWRAVVYSGLIAGAAFVIAEMVLVALFQGESPWTPVRMIAAILLGPDVLPPPATFDGGIAIVALVVHFALSIIYAAILAWIVRIVPMETLSTPQAASIGAIFALAIFLVNFYPIAAAAFPWFAEGRDWVTVVSHLLFGAVLGWSYLRLAHPHRMT